MQEEAFRMQIPVAVLLTRTGAAIETRVCAAFSPI